MILVSACLVGCHCRYDGDTNLINELKAMVERGEAIPVCPEQMGGLATPRPPAQIVGGDGHDVLENTAKVITDSGADVTDQFVKGAQEALQMAKMVNATTAILKERSPSCGSSMVYDGSFSGKKKPGLGVTATLLRQHGLDVYSEETYQSQQKD